MAGGGVLGADEKSGEGTPPEGRKLALAILRNGLRSKNFGQSGKIRKNFPILFPVAPSFLDLISGAEANHATDSDVASTKQLLSCPMFLNSWCLVVGQIAQRE